MSRELSPTRALFRSAASMPLDAASPEGRTAFFFRGRQMIERIFAKFVPAASYGTGTGLVVFGMISSQGFIAVFAGVCAALGGLYVQYQSTQRAKSRTKADIADKSEIIAELRKDLELLRWIARSRELLPVLPPDPLAFPCAADCPAATAAIDPIPLDAEPPGVTKP